MTLQSQQITFAYQTGHTVLDSVSLELGPGSVLGLFGPNGSGKSTLVRCLSGSLRPLSGRVLLDGQPLAAMSPRAIARRIAVVPQDTPADIPLSVREMVMLGRYAYGDFWGQESREDAAIVETCLQRLGMADLADRPFSQLSGGERQRTIVARALAQQGNVLLLDEPNSHLDLAHQWEVYRLARELAAEGQAVLLICHDLLLSPLMVDAAVVMDQGRVAATGPVSEVLRADLLQRVFATKASIFWSDGCRVSARLEP